MQYNTVSYPGKTIKLSAVAVGQRFGTVPSIIYSDFCYKFKQMNGTKSSLKDWQYTQRVGKQCTTLTYTITSPPQRKLTMEVKVENLGDLADILEESGKFNIQNKLPEPNFYLTNPLISIKMLPCPLGFEYDNPSMMCTCDSKLVENEINCSIDTQTVWRKSSF